MITENDRRFARCFFFFNSYIKISELQSCYLISKTQNLNHIVDYLCQKSNYNRSIKFWGCKIKKHHQANAKKQTKILLQLMKCTWYQTHAIVIIFVCLFPIRHFITIQFIITIILNLPSLSSQRITLAMQLCKQSNSLDVSNVIEFI